MTREDVKKAAEKIVMDWRNADRPALEKFLPKELAEIINAALEEAAKEMAGPQGSGWGDEPRRFCRLVDHVQGFCDCAERADAIRAMKIGAGE